jgi:hypothetical protein
MAIVSKNMTKNIAPQTATIFLPAWDSVASGLSAISLDGVTFGTGVTFVTVNNRYICANFPDASDAFLISMFRLPTNYVAGSDIDLEFTWSADVNTGNARLNCGITHVSSGGVYTQDTDTDVNYVGASNYTAPSTVNEVLKQSMTISGTGLIAGGAGALLVTREGINGGDTLSGNVYFFGAMLKCKVNSYGD